MPLDRGLFDVYREADLFLHVSWTEGLPQVLLEAFAARLPVVATEVGGVGPVARDAALLIPPGDAAAAAAAVRRLAGDAALREQLVEAGVARVRERTTEAERRRLVDFIRALARYAIAARAPASATCPRTPPLDTTRAASGRSTAPYQYLYGSAPRPKS